MDYRGYSIEKEKHYYKVTSPDGEEWTEDFIKDAKDAIDKELDN